MSHDFSINQKALIVRAARQRDQRVRGHRHTMEALVMRGYAVWGSPARVSIMLTAAGRRFAETGEQIAA